MYYYLPFFPLAASLGLYVAIRGPSIAFFIVCILFFLVCLLRVPFKLLVCIFLTFVLYYSNTVWTISQDQTTFKSGDQIIIGKIKTIPVIDGDSLSMRIKTVEQETIQVRAFLSTIGERQQLKRFSVGDVCQVNGALERSSPPSNFAGFDYQRYLEDQSIYWLLKPKQGGIECIEGDKNLYETLQAWRHKQLVKLENEVSPELVGIMGALLFGERFYIDDEVLSAYQRLGVIHLLAVSGLHVGLIIGSLFFIFIRLGITRERTIEVLLIFLPFYIIIAGSAPSVIRASFMGMVVLVCMRFHKRVHPIAGIVFVYMIYLLVQPFGLFHLGFQLSFLTSLGLILSSKTIVDRYFHPITQLIAVTLISQLVSFPILARQMFEIPLLGIPLNLFYIPFITFFILPFTIMAFIWSFLLPMFLNIPLTFLEMVVPVAHQFLIAVAKWKVGSYVIGKPSLIMVVLMFIVILFGFICWERGKGVRVASSLFLVLLIIQVSSPYFDPRAKVTMLDVGQGDSYLIELPFRKAVYLIDTGGTASYFDEEWRKRRREFDVGSDIVAPELKALGISQIDVLLLTHGHLDHIGGAVALSEKINIKHVLYRQGPISVGVDQEILGALVQNGATVHFVKGGVKWSEAQSTFRVLSPTGEERDENARSIVLVAEIDGVRFLFTGDLEQEGEERLLKDYPQLKIDILKVGHHGSKTGTTDAFLDQLKPRAAFVSAGRNNRFNHPHQEVIDRMEKRHIMMWRTDVNGAVRVTIDQGKIKVLRVND